MKNITRLGIYLAFPYAESHTFYREGIIRHQFFVLHALLKQYKDLNLEIWSVDINAAYFKQIFLEHLGQFQDRLEFCSVPLFYGNGSRNSSQALNFKMSWKKSMIAKIKRHPIGKLLRIYKKWLYSTAFFANKISTYKYNYDSPEQRFIVDYINQYHRCDLMYFTYNWGLGACLNMPKILVVHDLHTITYAQLFEDEVGKKQLEIDNAFLLENIRRFLANRSELIVLCEYVKKTQLCQLLPEISKDKINTIYTPIMVSEHINSIDKASLFKKYHLKPNLTYVFYPTQVRAQKNLSVVVKALHLLRTKHGLCLYLVSTGNPKHYPPLNKIIKQLKFSSYFIQLPSISDQDLYGFYAHSLCGVAPSYTEGNFPLQAMEALAMHTPVALANVQIILDRLQMLDNYDQNSLAEFFFDPDDAEKLAHIFLQIHQNGKQIAFAKQQNLLSELQKYTWDMAANNYYQVFQKVSNLDSDNPNSKIEENN